MASEKTCKDCMKVRPAEEFVDLHGHPTPLGKYCRECFIKHQQEKAISLMDGRDFCLYCGRKIKKVYASKPWRKRGMRYLQRDYMDPLALGGEKSERNMVYRCIVCHVTKGDRPFTEWLKMLLPECRELSREVYVEKHGHRPEDFIPAQVR